jgi:hypothetical protein
MSRSMAAFGVCTDCGRQGFKMMRMVVQSFRFQILNIELHTRELTRLVSENPTILFILHRQAFGE